MAAHLSRIWKVCHVSSPNLRFFLTSQVKLSCKRYSSHLLWASEVNCFGKLSVCSGIELHVKPSSTWEARQNQIAAYLISNSENALEGNEDNFKDILDCVVSNINDDTEYSDVTINIDTANIERKYQSSIINTSKILIELPHFYHLNINCSSTSKLTVEKIEGDIEINALGDCILSQLKSQLIRVHTSQGGITGKLSLIGDMVLTTGNNGHISLDKVQGNNINISCGDGDLRIKSLYGGNTILNSAFGDVHIGDAHGNVNLSSSDGNVLLGSISGLFKAIVDHGNIDAKLTTGGNIDATISNGDVTIKIDESLQCHLDLCAKTIDILSDFNMSEKSKRFSDGLVFVSGQKEGIGEQRVQVSCPRGRVKVLNESWFVLPRN